MPISTARALTDSLNLPIQNVFPTFTNVNVWSLLNSTGILTGSVPFGLMSPNCRAEKNPGGSNAQLKI